MNNKLCLIWRFAVVLALASGLLSPLGQTAQAAQITLGSSQLVKSSTGSTVNATSPVIDGAIDQAYGGPKASDPSGDGNSNAVMDLLDLYITDDADYFYFAFTINANIATTNWGKYIIYIDTTNDSNGAISDAWTRNVLANDPHKPEFSINSWVDASPYGSEDTQFWAWNQGTTSWSSTGTIDDAALAAGTPSVIEWQISKAALGNPDTIWVEAWSTGNGSNDNAQDTINNPADDWNASDWSTQAVINNSTQYGAPVIIPSASHDNNVWWNELGHDSRDTTYRTPGGPVKVGTPVFLRLRAASGDLTAAKVRLYDDRLDIQTILKMELVADDGTYEWWQTVVPTTTYETVYWYRFLAIDGTDTDYYEDDTNKTGGWGQTYDETEDNSFQLTVFEPGFHTPDWVKDAVIYQIFPDRFRDGDETNNTDPGTFFYNITDPISGTIFRSDPAGGESNAWNTIICDPRDETGCPEAYSQNFYGGDLQGIIDQLDYLENLGVTALYLNPIFESPSNHKYDATDYLTIDDNLGVLGDDAASLALFETLVDEAANHGMNIILDGVFNHVSSDSIYFDRYGRYPEVGACESNTSPYRSWFYFTDVTPGNGPCMGSTGIPNAANYSSWWNYDSLPKLNSSNPEVQNLIWALGGEDSVATYWLQPTRADGWRLDVGADVDPGVLNNPGNLYWEGFRDAVRDTNPEGYITGEEWGLANSWLLGNEWDAVMNYQFSTAVLSFWRDTIFEDNDHNSGSSAGPLSPLTPAELDERLLNLQERYAPEAFAAMLNLLGSHDTSRALFMLDHNTYQNDPGLYENQYYDWSDAIERLMGVAILQFTLPGAPTIYYGDEVGLVGPMSYHGGKWEDDPYNRQPYPWIDETGTPYYEHLQNGGDGQVELLDHYTTLANARNNHEALRTGSFDPLLVDNSEMVYAYGRRIATTHGDAALVIINRGSTDPITVTLEVSGYLPEGAIFTDVLGLPGSFTVTSGQITIEDIPPMFGAVLVLSSGDLALPAAPFNLTAIDGEAQVLLEWDAEPGDADSYNIYRSLLTGGGYELIGNTTQQIYTDTLVTNGIEYFYVVTGLKNNSLESVYSNEVAATPHWNIDWANLQSPSTINHTIGLTPTPDIYGQVFITDVTNLGGPTDGLIAQVGFGPTTTFPTEWEWWVDATFNVDSGDNDEFIGNLVPEYIGVFNYVYRYSTTDGRDWIYADQNGIFTDTLSAPGVLTVTASADTTPPVTPLNLELTDWGSDFLELTWDPVVGDATLFAYDLFRSEISGTVGTRIARILDPTTIYTDTDVTTGVTYYYHVQAVDSSFNHSGFSNQVEATPQPKIVQVNFTVTIPEFTPGDVYLTRFINADGTVGDWDPSATLMTRIDTETITGTFYIQDETEMEFKFARGSWDTVEKEADGNSEIANRVLVVDYGTTGVQEVNLAVANWRDPIVVDYFPEAYALEVDTGTSITVTWSQSLSATAGIDFSVTDPSGIVSGEFTYNDLSRTVVFTPEVPLEPTTNYSVLVTGNKDAGGDTQQVPVFWEFQTSPLPIVEFSDPTYQVDESSSSAVISLTLNAQPLLHTNITLISEDGTATSGEDYTPISVTLTFSPGVSFITTTIPITGDILVEEDETVSLTISNPVNAQLGIQSEAILTILDEDTFPELQFQNEDLSVSEGIGQANIVATLSFSYPLTITAAYTLTDGTATIGVDYNSLSQTLTFAPGDIVAGFDVAILDDALVEEDETLTITLGNPTNSLIAEPSETVLIILDDDSLPRVQFGAAIYHIGEDDITATITVTLSHAYALNASIDYTTEDGSATGDEDYTPISGTLTFAPGDTSTTFEVLISEDIYYEGNETIALTISNPVNANLGAIDQAILTIVDNEYQVLLPLVFKPE